MSAVPRGDGETVAVGVISHACVVKANRGKLALLAANGFRVAAIAPERWWERDRRRMISTEPDTEDAYDLRILPARQIRASLHWYKRGSLARTLREVRPSIVHVEEEPWSLVALQAVRLRRRLPFRLTLFSWENTIRDLPAPARLVQRAVLQRVDYVVAGSEGAKSVVRRAGYRGPIAVMPQHGVDLDMFTPRADLPGREARGYRRFVVGFVGRIVSEKGPDLLLRAFSKLGSDTTLVFVGDGPLMHDLRREADDMRLTDRVAFEQGVAHSDVPDQLTRMDVLAVPSRTTPSWREQFGHVLIEAMAAGVPVVGADSGEIPHVIGDAGLVFPEGDVGALAAALEALREETARDRLAQAGLRRVRARYTNAVVARNLADVFRSVLNPS